MVLQIEDLSQQVHRAAAEKFKVPAEPSILVPESAPGPRVRPECEEEDKDEEEVRVKMGGGGQTPAGEGQPQHLLLAPPGGRGWAGASGH